MAKLRVNRALRHQVPTAANAMFDPGDKVLVWREKIVNNRIGEWMGPYIVDKFDQDKKLVFVRYNDDTAKQFGLTQIRRYYEPEQISFTFLTEINERLQYFRNSPDMSYPTEVIHPSDSRARTPEMAQAIEKEVRGLFNRGTFEIIGKEDVPTDANILPGRFVLAIKSTEDGSIKYKAIFVMGGHRDKHKHLMVHNSCTLQPQSIRLLLALAVMYDFDVWTADVAQAYLQSTDPLLREIFVTKRIPEFKINADQCLKLVKPLYGLCDAGDLWSSTMDKHHRLALEMVPLRSEPACYIKHEDGKLVGISGSYVDDLLRAGKKSFRDECRKTYEAFDMGEEEDLPCDFTGFYLRRDGDSILQHQRSHLKNSETLQSSATFPDFRSMRMKLAWISHTRADVLFEISQLAQITEERFQKERSACIRRINKAVRFAKNHDIAIKVPKLWFETLRVVGYSDSSFANNWDLTTQLGHIVLLVDGNGRAARISFNSYKARRVVRSAMPGEVIAFSDMFDVAVTLVQELCTINNRKVSLQLLTDSKSLLDVISKGSKTSEKRLMLDIAAAREGFRDEIISDVGFVRTNHNLADSLTKPMKQTMLQSVLAAGQVKIYVEQWIIRD